MFTKTAIITGSAGNLGQAVADKFLNGDYQVIGTIHKTKETSSSSKNNFKEVQLDLLNEEECQKFVDQIVTENKEINVAVLTAGGFAMGDINSTKSSDIAAQMALNFETAYNIARPVFLQMMKQNYGRIFLIGSQPGLNTKSAKKVLAYGLSKSLIFRLAEILNTDAKEKNVVTSVIVPSTIDTPQNRKAMPGADFSKWVTPAQIADVIYFYSGEEASVIREPIIKVYNNG